MIISTSHTNSVCRSTITPVCWQIDHLVGQAKMLSLSTYMKSPQSSISSISSISSFSYQYTRAQSVLVISIASVDRNTGQCCYSMYHPPKAISEIVYPWDGYRHFIFTYRHVIAILTLPKWATSTHQSFRSVIPRKGVVPRPSQLTTQTLPKYWSDLLLMVTLTLNSVSRSRIQWIPTRLRHQTASRKTLQSRAVCCPRLSYFWVHYPVSYFPARVF